MMSPSTLIPVLVDAALRSLLVAAVVGLGLAVLRARNVVAQKAAWMLVLAAAVLMPWAARWAAQAAWMPHVAALPIAVREAAPAVVREPVAASHEETVVERPMMALDPVPVVRAHSSPARPVVSAPTAAVGKSIHAAAVAADVANAMVNPPAAAAKLPHLSAWSIALLVYAAGCAVLLLRLLYGLGAAAFLWFSAKPLTWDAYIDVEGPAIRASKQVSAPVTIGSGIVLPADFGAWDGEKLRIVLAHEASHVRQLDFWLQLSASLYTAIFWFSPLGWWLKRKLGDLSETISDRAAVEHAASHASYAQVLLEFAAMPRPIPMGVAMAHHGRLISRIDRLLNESSFRQAFAGGRARIAAAVLLVPAALFAATTLVRVQAQAVAPPPAAVAPTAPSVQPAPPQEPAPAPAAEPSQEAPVPPPTAQEPASPDVAPVPPPANGAAPVPPSAAIGPDGADLLYIPKNQAMAKMRLDMAQSAAGRARIMAMKGDMDAKFAAMRNMAAFKGVRTYGRYGYGFGDDGNSYAYVTGTGERSVHFSGNWYETSKSEIEKARKVAHGDFLWFERDGKSYVIDDPAALAQLKPMQDRMEALGAQQEELGKQQEVLGRQQEELGKQQELASVPTPDMSKELASLTEAIKKLDAQKGGTVTQVQLAEIEGKIGDLQGKIGGIEGQIGEKQGELGEKQGKLGEQQGELGEKQGRLGAEQGRIAREMDGKVLTIIDEYMKSGKARQVE